MVCICVCVCKTRFVADRRTLCLAAEKKGKIRSKRNGTQMEELRRACLTLLNGNSNSSL